MEHFLQATKRGSAVSSIRGGRSAAETLIRSVKPREYAATRNMFDGAVTRLSPYLRHGVVTLAEVREKVLERNSVRDAYKLLQELAWRDYYQRVYERLGNDIWSNIEPYKTGITRYQEKLPEDIEQGTTGAACIDSFVHDLREVGYLHNHARMWTAAYVVHHRRIRWQAGAYWFLQHLLDGDPASNNLSWQWVASTFAAKPYYFNRENLARYTNNVYCDKCPLASAGCPFVGSYEEVADRIFPGAASSVEMASPTQTALSRRLSRGDEAYDNNENDDKNIAENVQPILVWINEESLDPRGPALVSHPDATPLFVFDEAAIEKDRWSLKRLAFVYECLLEIPNIQIYRGTTTEIMKALCKDFGYKVIATTSMVDPRLRMVLSAARKFVEVQQYPVAAFVPVGQVRDLRRFSRYWHDVENVVV